jgi:hypothetical protein
MPGVAFPPVGRLGFTSPRSSVLCSAKTARYPSRVASLALASQYLACFLALCSLRLMRERKLSSHARALGHPVPLVFRVCVHKEIVGSPKFPSFPSDDMLRSLQTPVVSCALAVSRTGLLPSTRARVSAFSLASTEIILRTTTLLFSGLTPAAYRLATPGSVQPLTTLHAGSLLSCWLGVAQVGLEFENSHPLGNVDLFREVSSSP